MTTIIALRRFNKAYVNIAKKEILVKNNDMLDVKIENMNMQIFVIVVVTGTLKHLTLNDQVIIENKRWESETIGTAIQQCKQSSLDLKALWVDKYV